MTIAPLCFMIRHVLTQPIVTAASSMRDKPSRAPRMYTTKGRSLLVELHGASVSVTGVEKDCAVKTQHTIKQHIHNVKMLYSIRT